VAPHDGARRFLSAIWPLIVPGAAKTHWRPLFSVARRVRRPIHERRGGLKKLMNRTRLEEVQTRENAKGRNTSRAIKLQSFGRGGDQG